MRNEIGSHFEKDHSILQEMKASQWLPKTSDDTYTFLGRTAITVAIKDILKTQSINTVYMPTYSCTSMVDPFIEKGINVEYYDVYYDETGVNYNINFDTNCDIFFAMTYFGLENSKKMNDAMKVFSSRGTIIIEDITHRLLNKNSHSKNADYYIASLRKWFPIASGGYVGKRNGNLSIKPEKTSDHLVTKQLEAMDYKSQYLAGESISKEKFLSMFASFNKVLSTIDENYMIDQKSLRIIKFLNIDLIRKRRKKNANKLYSKIKNINSVKPLFTKPNLSTKCPLFVPIVTDQENRDDLRNYLIKNDVYCPVHWPKKSTGKNSVLSNRSISLICDQRYNTRDMKYIVNLIKKWEENI